MDESGSIGTKEFDLMKSFLSQLVGRLDINSGNTRVGLVTYSPTITTSIDLNAGMSVAGLQSAINSLTYRGGDTNTFLALEYVRTRILTSAAGDRSDVPNIVVVLTDGHSHNSTATKVSSKFTERFCHVSYARQSIMGMQVVLAQCDVSVN